MKAFGHLVQISGKKITLELDDETQIKRIGTFANGAVPVVEVDIKVDDLVLTEKKEKSFRKINDVLAIEDALTRISNQLQKAIKQLNELTISDVRVQLMKEQTKKVKAETDELGGASSNNEVEDWKKAVINAANKRAVKENE